MSLDTLVLVLTVAAFLLFLGFEALFPAQRTLPDIPNWRLIGSAGLALTMMVNVFGPLVILPWFAGMGLFDLSGWGNWGAFPLIVLTSFFTYWSHRIQHRYDVLWRVGGHQLHHAAARVDVASAYIFHPVDAFIQLFWALLAGTLLGVSPVAGAIGGLGYFCIGLYQHLNVNTPRWTNWFIQRPEAHLRHHEFNVHARNFGDLPVWDMLFGTYFNPDRSDDIRVGFEEGRGRRWIAMMAMVDVNRAQGRERM